MLRVFAVSDGAQSWRVLPGGLTRIAGAELEIASMQRGGSSADTWVLTEGEVDRTSLLHHDQPAVDIAASQPHASPAARRKTCSGWAATPSAPRTPRGWPG